MSEIDMIPRSYIDAIRLNKAVTRFMYALCLLLACGAIGFATVRWQTAVETPRLAALRAATEQGEAARKLQDGLRVQKAALDQRVAVLAALRGAGDVARTADAIEGALGTGVWFRELRYSREEQLVLPTVPGAPAAPAAPSGATSGATSGVQPQSSAFMVSLPLDATGKASTTEQTTWRLARNIDIIGEAIDHAALTAFLLNLGAQPAVTDVRFLKSGVHAGATGSGADVIDFTLSAAARASRRTVP